MTCCDFATVEGHKHKNNRLHINVWLIKNNTKNNLDNYKHLKLL